MNAAPSNLFDAFTLETTARDSAQFHRDGALLPPGTRVNIAYLSSETLEQRLEAVSTLVQQGLSPFPIISSRRLGSVDVLERYLSEAIRLADIRGILLVGGDPATPQGPFNDSLEVINSGLLQRFKLQSVSIAGYPQGHPKIADEVLWRYLEQKVRALQDQGCAVDITTQLTFDAEAVVAWIEQVRRAGIQAPIHIGVPSPSTLPGLLKFASQCRVGVSMAMIKQYGWKATSLLSNVGPEAFLAVLQQAVAQRDLGDVRLHVFPLTGLPTMMHWINGYSDGR
ncbi:methylenetetrahydrofolate reductase [Pseudomonas sp. SZMC_28357]|uniref:methylenetetrahydrofolate reductase n=1 Tax=Pseudomonas sp. SZMC_28357 TaxID=3074380 RepID=UPI00287247BC|nr:methylenetetrahydrofolate reductase [Pseudomonas sp. SZMC_28357]MDR9752659.1 methylenetetrahydrofolate reductase [Pseudomonas sp. SZMC_28357]